MTKVPCHCGAIYEICSSTARRTKSNLQGWLSLVNLVVAVFQIEMHLIDVTELPLNCGDIGKSWQPGFVAEVLDLVGGSSAGETEMLLPLFEASAR